jgi:hypothetical protein
MANQGFRSAQTDRQFEYLKAPVTTAVLSDNLFMTFHPPNFPSTDVLANLLKETGGSWRK